MSRNSSYARQELDVPMPLAIGIGCVVLVGIYILLFPVKDTFIGVLLYERGLTQPLVIFLAGTASAIALLKFIKIQREFKALRQLWIPPNISLEDPDSRQVAKLEYALSHSGYLLAIRCSRIIKAYIESGSGKTATELALDDSSFYLSASESSYSIPRILVWAIPLLGFIGTVVGISRAVNGFSGFLEQAAEIDQIKEGIGTVTSGLAVAFDTTLLALLLSVLVMIPVVLVERFESKFLLGIDVYINEQVLPKLKGRSEGLNESAIARSVTQAVQDSLPEPEALIQPARDYAQQAASEIAQSFVAEIGQVRDMTEKLIQQAGKINQIALKDRQDFISTFEGQQQTTRDLVKETQEKLTEISSNQTAVANQLARQSKQIMQQLEQATQALTHRVDALEECTNQILEVARLQQGLEYSLHSLKETNQLGTVLSELQGNLTQLRPVLQKLGKPRRITFMEGDD
ncbi:MotA/TolQ/ExbB proton channel family protein [Lusitaniella coriacea]|uniref:MotA/TolQ/ExbB proton channel family protein n=1 Tax=Lusitaniella coriacea TaxID=1983105 RepID=UPI003CEA0E22